MKKFKKVDLFLIEEMKKEQSEDMFVTILVALLGLALVIILIISVGIEMKK